MKFVYKHKVGRLPTFKDVLTSDLNQIISVTTELIRSTFEKADSSKMPEKTRNYWKKVGTNSSTFLKCWDRFLTHWQEMQHVKLTTEVLNIGCSSCFKPKHKCSSIYWICTWPDIPPSKPTKELNFVGLYYTLNNMIN